MSQKRKYRGARKSISFKPIGGGLRASEERIKEQARTITSGLEFALASQKQADKLKIEGYADKVSFEKGVQEKKDRLIEIADKRKIEATELRAKREVENLKGIADEYGKQADFYSKIAPKQAEAIQKLGQGAWDLSEAIEYIQLNEHRRKTEENEELQNSALKKQVQRMQSLFTDIEKRRSSAVKEATDKGEELSADVLAKYDSLDPEEIFQIFGKYFRTNTHQGKEMLTYFKDNINLIFSDLEDIFNDKDLRIKINQSNAEEWYRWGAYRFLKKWGIHPRSKEGSQLVDAFLAKGRLRSKGIRDQTRSDKTAAMRFQIGKDIINELSNPSENDDWLNLGLNSLTYVTRTGVHKDEKSGYTYGVENDNTALAGKESVIYLVTTFPEKFNETKIRELMDRFVIQDTLGVKGDKTPYGKRHPTGVEEIIDEWSKAAKGKKERLNSKVDSENIAIVEAFRLRQDNHNKFKKDGVDDKGNPYTKTDAEFRIEELEATRTVVGGNERAKNEIYSALQVTSTNYANVSHIVNIERFFLDGDTRSAANYYLSLTPTKQEQLRHRYDLFNNIVKSGWQNSSGNTGVKGIYEEVRNWVISDEVKDGSGQRQLSDTGEETVNDLVNEILTKAKSAAPTLGWEKAIAAAVAEERALYDQGFDPTNPQNLVEGAKYARVKKGYLDNDSTYRDRFHYPRKHFIKSEPIVLDLAELRKQGFNLADITKANNELAAKLSDVEQFSDETIALQLARSNWTINEYITNDQVFTPKVKSDILAYATALKNGDITFGYDIPERVNVIAEKFNMSTVDVLNLLLEDAQPKDEKEKIRFTQDGHSIQKFIGQEWKEPKLPERFLNLAGKSYFDSARAQGIIPERAWVRAFTEEGLSQSESFMKSIGITNTFNEYGNLVLSDSRRFIENDGIQQLSIEDTFNFIPSLRNIDFYREKNAGITTYDIYEVNELKAQLQELKNNPPGHKGSGRYPNLKVIRTPEGIPVKKKWRQDIKNLEKRIKEIENGQ